MARLKGSVLGELSGKLGNLTARIVNGKTIFAQRPTSFHVNMAPELVAIRNQFAVTVSLAKNLIALSGLYQVWTRVKTAGMSAFNYAVKMNFDSSAADKPTTANILTPNDGFPLNVTTAEVGADTVTAQIEALDTVMIPTEEERQFTPNIVICYYNPTNPEDAPYAIVPVKALPQLMDTVNPIALNVALNIVQQQTAAKYQNSILYLALTTSDLDGKVIQYSATYAQDS